ncbi:MAG: thioredoxin domain-containing protein [Planctomycetota bacterium]|jgi:hypothetical protein
MSDRLESIDGANWEEFISAPVAVLMLGKTDCPACQAWTEELTGMLADAGRWSDVRFGKMLIDTRGLIGFKKANPWLAEVDTLPFNVIYKEGERLKTFAGGGGDRLDKRLGKILG